MPEATSLETFIWEYLQPKINALITRRLCELQDALVERGQLSPPSPEPDARESASHYTEDCAV